MAKNQNARHRLPTLPRATLNRRAERERERDVPATAASPLRIHLVPPPEALPLSSPACFPAQSQSRADPNPIISGFYRKPPPASPESVLRPSVPSSSTYGEGLHLLDDVVGGGRHGDDAAAGGAHGAHGGRAQSLGGRGVRNLDEERRRRVCNRQNGFAAEFLLESRQ